MYVGISRIKREKTMKQDRRSILKTLLAAPAAVISFNKTSEATEKITYGMIDLDEPLPEIDLKRMCTSSGTIPKCSG